MTEPLATSTDIVGRLGRALTEEERTKIDGLILDASSSVVAYSGQTFVSAPITQLLAIRNRGVKLPLRPVTAVASVVDQFGNHLPFIWVTGDEVVTLASSTWINSFELNLLPWTRVSKVSVTYTAGYATVPDDVLGVVCQIALRSLGAPGIESGLVSETIAGYAYTQSPEASAGPYGLLPDEKRVLDAYRVLAGPVMML